MMDSKVSGNVRIKLEMRALNRNQMSNQLRMTQGLGGLNM